MSFYPPPNASFIPAQPLLTLIRPAFDRLRALVKATSSGAKSARECLKLPVINPTQLPWSPLATAELDWQASTPISRSSGDIYFSADDGLAESDYVFIEGNQLRQRWPVLEASEQFVIAEIGLGTALNACLTIATWLAHRPPGSQLHYIGLERAPLRPYDMQRALHQWPQLRAVLASLIARWPDPLAGCHRRYFDDWGVTLDLWWGDAEQILSDLASHATPWVDAWYLDGFAPAKEPGPWRTETFTSMAALSRTGATCSTFTAASAVRRGLTTAGFKMHKRPGYGRKREALWGTLDKPPKRSPSLTPWDLNPTPQATASAIVVGAGLAGAHIAQALARRGVLVTVLEAATIAGEGSGNLQGVTYTRLSHQHNPLTDFSLAAFSYATDYHRSLMHSDLLALGTDIGLGGYIQLHERDNTLTHLEQVLCRAPELARVLSASEIAAITGLQPRCDGIHYLRGGWLDPRALCRVLLDHPLITVKAHCGVISLSRRDDQWLASSPADPQLAKAPAAVLATARQATQQAELAWLPLTSIRGQTTHVPATDVLAGLRIPVCDEGYLPPARNGTHCIGASFGPGDAQTDEREEEHAHNIEMMRRALPNLELIPPSGGWRGHVALRCNSNDYLPVAGMVPRINDFNQRYAALANDRKRLIDAAAPLYPGLAVLTSLGSRGLTAAPLAAERVVDQLLGTPPCLPRYLQRAISPARFAERALKRGGAL